MLSTQTTRRFVACINPHIFYSLRDNLAYLSLEQFVHISVKKRFELYIEVREVLEPGVFRQRLKLWQLAEWAHAVNNTALSDLHREVQSRTLAAAAVGAA